jgi:hypothetical protein
LVTVSVMPVPTLNVPPLVPRVTPLLALVRAKLAVGWKVPPFRRSCAALKPAGLPACYS